MTNYTDQKSDAKWFPNKTSAYGWMRANKAPDTEYLLADRTKGKRDGYNIAVYVKDKRQGYVKHTLSRTPNRSHATVFPSDRQAEAFTRAVKIDGYTFRPIRKDQNNHNQGFVIMWLKDGLTIGYVTEAGQ